jgi:hypothetical protein
MKRTAKVVADSLKSRENSHLGHILRDLIHSLDGLRDCGVITIPYLHVKIRSAYVSQKKIFKSKRGKS